MFIVKSEPFLPLIHYIFFILIHKIYLTISTKHLPSLFYSIIILCRHLSFPLLRKLGFDRLSCRIVLIVGAHV